MIFDAEYYRQRDVDLTRKAMKYGMAQYAEDWAMAIACAEIMSDDNHPHLQPVLNSAFTRMEAFEANNPGALPWEEE